MASTVRKNFAFDPVAVKQLEEIAASMNTSLTKTLEKLISSSYEHIEKKRRLKAAKKVAGSASGIFVEKTIQEIKENRDV